MSVGPIQRGINSLLGRLSGVGPQGAQGPQGPGTSAAARPPVEGIKPLPQRPSFYQRYQQDAFEGSPKRGGRGGGGLDLSGGQRDFGAPAQGQGQEQAKAKQPPQASAAVGAAQPGKKQEPVQVMEFRKGKPARERDEFQQQPQKAQSDKGAEAPKAPKSKPKPKPQRPPTPMKGSPFKQVVKGGEVKTEVRTNAERLADGPSGTKGEVAAAQAAAQQSPSKG